MPFYGCEIEKSMHLRQYTYTKRNEIHSEAILIVCDFSFGLCFVFVFFFFWGIGYVMFDAIVFGIVVTICLFLHHYDMNDKFVFHIDLCERKIKLICDKVTNEFYQWSNSNV